MRSRAIGKRWEQYRKANSKHPHVRENELKKILSLLQPSAGEKIWEVGTGNGCLTFPIAQAVGNTGEIIGTDIDQESVLELTRKNIQKKLNIITRLLPVKYPLLDKEYTGYFDAIVTIATFHHFDNKKGATGKNGRVAAIETFYKSLKKGGRLVMSDPLHGTITQKYFDIIDISRQCYPDGHPHNFFTKAKLKRTVQKAGFKNISIDKVRVPWKFNSKIEAMNFIHTIHNATCATKKSFEIAKNVLGFKKNHGHYELGWELFFLTAKK